MRVFSLLADGLKGGLVEVEFHSRFQIPSFQILGLPAPEIQEAKERIMAAFQAAELEFPKKKVIVNLAPASVRKSGTGHDLSIAIKILSEVIDHAWPESLLAWGELSLEGLVKPAGKIALLIDVLLEKFPEGAPTLILSRRDYDLLLDLLSWRAQSNLSHPKNLKIQVIENLGEIAVPLEPTWVNIHQRPARILPTTFPATPLLGLPPRAERVLKLALIGKHHVLLLGPKGIGKSESIRWYESLLPEGNPDQLWQKILISENRGLPLDFSPPVRRVHAQVKPAHLLGSLRDRGYYPGELALAHGGIFIADEFMEWPRDSKECLREPLQTKKIFLTRVQGHIECPSDFQMIATGNLCPCGGLPTAFRLDLPSKKFTCRCRSIDIEHYLKKLSGPVLDRIDLSFIMTEVDRPKFNAEDFQTIQTQIKKARAFALNHFGMLPADLSPSWLDQMLLAKPGVETLLADVTSLRARHKILRVARSIQALEQSKTLNEEHVFEAKWYRFDPEVTH